MAPVEVVGFTRQLPIRGCAVRRLRRARKIEAGAESLMALPVEAFRPGKPLFMEAG